MDPHMAHRPVSIILAIALGVGGAPLVHAATERPAAKHTAVRARGPHGARAHPKFRASRTAAAAEARRLGAAVGQGCNGRADMARSDHQWVVLCSNGKTYLLDMPAGAAAPQAPAVECSLAGTRPQPACFAE